MPVPRVNANLQRSGKAAAPPGRGRFENAVARKGNSVRLWSAVCLAEGPGGPRPATARDLLRILWEKGAKVLCDFHTHLYDEPNYAAALAETAQNLGFDKICISGGEARFGMGSNEELLVQADEYPDLFVPFAFVRLGFDAAADVQEMAGMGFRGLRVWAPPAPYDAEEFYPVYEAAEALEMPILFHTGFLPVTPLDRALDVRSHRMRPVYLDTLARRFPGLKIVGRGLGGPWYEEASETLRRHKNVFFDLSGWALRREGVQFFRARFGSENGTLVGETADDGVWSRILFGTAARYEEIAAVERDYQRLFRSLALPSEVVDDIMGGTAARILGLAEDA